MKKLASVMIGMTLVLGSAIGSASAGDFFGIKRRAENRENERHEKNKAGIERRHRERMDKVANSKKPLDEKLSEGREHQVIKERSHGRERARHTNKLSDIRSRNSLGMKKREKAPKTSSSTKSKTKSPKAQGAGKSKGGAKSTKKSRLF